MVSRCSTHNLGDKICRTRPMEQAPAEDSTPTTGERHGESESSERQTAVMSAASTVSFATNVTSGVSAKSGAAVASMVRRSRKGFGMAGTKKKRPVLKIESGASNAVPKEGEVPPPPVEAPAADSEEKPAVEGEAWWKVEYKCPPPGHLGAHLVPVSNESSPSAAAGSASESGDQDQSSPIGLRALVSGAESSPGSRKRIFPSHETPERAYRRVHNDVLRALGSIPSRTVHLYWLESGRLVRED